MPFRRNNRRQKQLKKEIKEIVKAQIETKDRIKLEVQAIIPHHHAADVYFKELTSLNQGVESTNRVGVRVKGQRISLNIMLRNFDNTASLPSAVRVMVVKAKKCPLTQAGLAYLNPASPLDSYNSIIDSDTATVKHDKVYQCGPQDTAGGKYGGYPPFRVIDLNLKGLGTIEYADGADAEAVGFGTYLLAWRVDNSGGVAGSHTLLTMNSRFYYKDA